MKRIKKGMISLPVKRTLSKETFESGKPSRFQLVLAAVLMVEIVYLAYSFWLLSIPESVYLFDGESLISKYGVYVEDFLGEYGSGYYLDNSLHADEEDLALLGTEEYDDENKFLTVMTPEVDLPRGSYEVVIQYSSSYLATYTVSSEYNTFPVVTGNQSTGFQASDWGTCVISFTSPIKVDGCQISTQYLGTGYLFISSITFRETAAWKQINLVIAVIVFLVLDAALVLFHLPGTRPDANQRVVLASLLVLILFSSYPLFQYFLYSGDDLRFHLYRIDAIKNALLDGQFPVRAAYSWANNYGYATSIFYGDIFLYIPAVLEIIGFNVQDSYKIYVFLVNTATCLLAYYSFHRISGRKLSSLLGCFLYMLAPYRLECVYQRAAVGEYTAMAFLPLILYGIWRIFAEPTDSPDYRHHWVPAVLGFTGLILSHMSTTLFAGMFTILACLLLIRKTLQLPRLRQLLKVVGYTALLGCWFIIPFLDYMRFDYGIKTNGFQGKIRAHAASLSDLFNLFPAGTGESISIPSALTDTDGNMAFTVGAGLMAAAVVFLMLKLHGNVEKDSAGRLGTLSLGLGGLALFMCTTLFPWDSMEQSGWILAFIANNIQYPWRLLGIASLFLAAVGTCLVICLKKSPLSSMTNVIVTGIAILAVMSGGYYLSSYCAEADFDYISELSPSTSVIAPEYLPIDFDESVFSDVSLESEGRLTQMSYERDGGTVTVSCVNETDSETYIDLPILYYRDYAARDLSTGDELVVISAESAKVRVIIPAGYSGSFAVRFAEPWYWRVSELISFLMLAGVVISSIPGCRKKLRRCRIASSS